MNVAGMTSPFWGCCQRTRASKPEIAPVESQIAEAVRIRCDEGFPAAELAGTLKAGLVRRQDEEHREWLTDIEAARLDRGSDPPGPRAQQVGPQDQLPALERVAEANRCVVGVEALGRWNDPARGMVPPRSGSSVSTVSR